MRLGIDLDNTIIRYDSLFAQLAAEKRLLPQHVAPTKQAIRDYLRAQGQESRWTELQGIAYGRRIEEAAPFEGVQEFFRRCEASKIEWCIISHRTRVPFVGEETDLHAAARDWLLRRGIVSLDQLDRVKLETSREAKLQSILQAECEVFIDDLPELLVDPAFPQNVCRILFDPANQNSDATDYYRATSWYEIAKLLGI